EQKRTQDGVTFYDFKFAGCLIEAHDEGDDSSLISVREDGVYAFSCFHRSHQYKWTEAKPLIEARFNAKFDFTGGTVTIGKSTPTEPTPAARRLQLASHSSMQSTVMEWYWPGRLARVHITTINGDPGNRKGLAT